MAKQQGKFAFVPFRPFTNIVINIFGEYFGNKVKLGQIKLNSKQVHAIENEPSDNIALWKNVLGCLTLICPNPWCTC